MITLSEWLPFLRPVLGLIGRVFGRHRITIEARTYAHLVGDFPLDMDPELHWGARVTVRHVAGRPITLETIRFETYRTFLHRWVRRRSSTKRIRSKQFPQRLEEGAIHTAHVCLHASKLAEIACHGQVWIAVTYSASQRPLIARFATYELSQKEYQKLWDSYDGGDNQEAEEEYYEYLARIERKREQQKDFFKKH